MISKIKIEMFLICVLIAVCVLLAPGRYVKADFVFGEPENLGPGVNTAGFESAAGISNDGLSFYFVRDRVELLVSTRATKDDPWDAALDLGLLSPDDLPMTASSIESLVNITTADGLEGYYAAQLPGGYGRRDIWFMKRETTDADWGSLMNLGPAVNTQFDEHLACISPNGLELYFSGYDEEGARPGGYGHSDLWVTRRANRDETWTEPENLGPSINSTYLDARPSISPDGLLLFFDSERPGGFGSLDLYVMRRRSLSDPWSEPVNLGPLVNTTADEECARISADGSTLYWDSDRQGGYGGNDMWKAAIVPVVDLNSDGIVNASDMTILVDHWGDDDPFCDIGPTPFGDGIVDVQDLIVLAEHLFEEIPLAD